VRETNLAFVIAVVSMDFGCNRYILSDIVFVLDDVYLTFMYRKLGIFVVICLHVLGIMAHNS
jgi:hypothetical protein